MEKRERFTFRFMPRLASSSPGLKSCWLIAEILRNRISPILLHKRRLRSETPLKSGCTAREVNVSAGDEFNKHSTAGSATTLTERFDPMAFVEPPRCPRSFPYLLYAAGPLTYSLVR